MNFLNRASQAKIIPVTTTIFVVASIICFVGIAYYLAVQSPANQRAQIELEKTRLASQNDQDKEARLDSCLAECYRKYRDRWKRNCESRNIKVDEDGGCSLPSELVKHLDAEYKSLREECLERYK